MSRWSGSADLCNPVERNEEVVPDAPLAGERLTPGTRQLVVPATALPSALDPAAFDQPAVLESVQGGVEGRDVKINRAFRAARDQQTDFVAVTLALFEERQDEELSAAAFELALQLVCDHILAQT